MDTTTQFLRTFYSQKFASFEEFQSKLKDFERLTGSVYIIKSSKKLPETTADRDRLVYSSLQYSAKIDSRVRSLQVQEPGKEDIVISEDIQVVLDDIVDQLPAHNTSEESPKSSSPNKSPKSSEPPRTTHVERKAAARDRLAARTKKARGLKLAPCLRRLAELASSGSVKDFHKHLGELEALVSIWRRGGVSSLASESPEAAVSEVGGVSLSSISDNSTGEVSGPAKGPSTPGNQTIVGYVLQPIHSVGAQGSFVSPTVLPSNFIPIAPKGPVPEVIQPFQHILPPQPKSVRPPMPVCKPKPLKPKIKQDKSKSPLKDNQNVSDPSAPYLQPFESNESPRPWTSMIMEGDSCPYFLYIEDANFYYSAVEDAWLPVDQQTAAVES
ncbi:unnamed protein product [Dibothriocephalus latus]|uniref:Uncharacterized protein n=1 Tax=Dibothriocephalus latus TaxID=60516 RepID=A0A3P7NWZ8_DIBLA|nr:unnamed protein product [Dibothriocephalus latus]